MCARGGQNDLTEPPSLSDCALQRDNLFFHFGPSTERHLRTQTVVVVLQGFSNNQSEQHFASTVECSKSPENLITSK